MKKSYLTLLAIAGLFMTSCGGGDEENKTEKKEEGEQKQEEVTSVSFMVDEENSSLEWIGFKEQKTDYKHTGQANIVYASIGTQMTDTYMKIDGGTVRVDLTTLREPGADPEMEEKLIGHLSSVDFFNVSEYQFAELKIENHDLDNNVITGSLSVLGIEIPVTIEDPEMMYDGEQLTVKVEFEVDLSPASMPGTQAKDGEEEEKISDVVKINATVVLNKN